MREFDSENESLLCYYVITYSNSFIIRLKIIYAYETVSLSKIQLISINIYGFYVSNYVVR